MRGSLAAATGQSIMDRVMAAKHSLAGSQLAKGVYKATTEELMPPKKKHLDYLIQCSSEPNVSIPHMADLMIERTFCSSWIPVFKSLISIHTLMNYGNERFMQYLASNNCTLQLANFIDKSTPLGYEMSDYVRRYSRYLNEKALSYRQMALDFCKIKRGREDGLLRTMPADKLLKTLPVLQQQVDALLEFDVRPAELSNAIIHAAFIMLFKDLIRLFACYNDGMINLLQKFFDMSKKQAKDALDLYKRFLVRMDKIGEFLRVAEAVGIDKGEIPDLTRAPASLLQTLENHLNSMVDTSASTRRPGPVPAPASAASSATAAQPTAAGAGSNSVGISEEEKRRIILEEEKQLNIIKENSIKRSSVSGSSAAARGSVAPSDVSAFSPPTPPSAVPASLDSAATQSQPAVTTDLLGSLEANSNAAANASAAQANPFLAMLQQPYVPPAAPVNEPWNPFPVAPPNASTGAYLGLGTSQPIARASISFPGQPPSYHASVYPQMAATNSFNSPLSSAQWNASQAINFDTAFPPSSANPWQPRPSFSEPLVPMPASQSLSRANAGFGDLLVPKQAGANTQGVNGQAQSTAGSASTGGRNLMVNDSGDIDSTLSNLAGNLAIGNPAAYRKQEWPQAQRSTQPIGAMAAASNQPLSMFASNAINSNQYNFYPPSAGRVSVSGNLSAPGWGVGTSQASYPTANDPFGGL